MSLDSNERGHVSQRYQAETLPISYEIPRPPLPKPYHPSWQYPPTDNPFPASILALAASTAALSPFTIHNSPGPCHKNPNSNVNVKSTKAVLCIWVTPSVPASTSADDQAQRVNNGISNMSHSSAGFSVDRNEDIAKRDMDNVKGRRAPQITSESVLSSAETASNGSPSSLSQSSPTRESVTGSPTSLVSSSILTLTTVPVPGTSATSTPPAFTPTITSITTTTTFPLASSAPASSTTPANGVASPKSTSTPSPTTGTTTTTISSSPDPRSILTSTTTSRAMTSSTTSIPPSFPTITFSKTSFTTSISGLPTSLTFTTPPSASIPFSSIATSASVTVTDITSFTSSLSTFTSSFITTPSSSISPSSPDSDSTSLKNSKSPLLLTQSSTYTTHPTMIFSSSITIWSTITSTKVYTSTLPDGGTTVVTTVIQSGVLSTNTSLSGNRFSSNTGAVIAVAVCATVVLIIFVFVVFFLCKRYRERKERQRRRKSRRPGLRLPAVPVSRPGTGNSSGSGGVGDSRANILGTGYGREWSRSRSGEAVMDGGEAGPSEDGEDEEDVWRSPLVGEDDDVGMGMGGLTTPPESGEDKPAGGRKSSIGHQSGNSHSLGHSLAHSQSSSAHHGQGQGVPPSMAEFGMGPVSYAAYAYPPALVGYHSGVAAGGVSDGEGNGAPGEGEGHSRGLGSHGSRASYGAFVPYGPNGLLVPYPSPVAISGVGAGCHVLPTTNGVETKDKPGQRPGSSRRESEGESSSAAGGHATAISASATTATAVGASGLVSTSTTASGSRRTSGSKGSLRSIGSKNLRGFMDRIRTSVPNIQVTDGVLPARRSSKDMSSPTSASGSGGERPGYDYGAVGRPRLVSGGVHAPPPVAFVYPGFHITPPGVPGADVPIDLPSDPRVDIISNHYHGPILYGYPVPAVNGEGGVDEDEDDSLRITSGVVTDGLLDPNLSLIGGGSGDGGSVGGRSSPNVEGASLRDYVDYSRKIGGMIKNHVTRSTTTFDTVDQDGSIHLFASGGGPPTPG